MLATARPNTSHEAIVKRMSFAFASDVPATHTQGAPRAREALAFLSAIGAKHTSRWLTSALEGRRDQDGLARLDQQFNEKAEDLASLAITYIARRR